MFKHNTTTATVTDGRLTLMTKNARSPGVIAMGLDQVRAGSFETSPADNDGFALVFKPAGRKTPETLAVYNTQAQAVKALDTVFAALSRGSKPAKGFWGGLMKIIGIIILLLLLLFVVITVWGLNMVNEDINNMTAQETVMNTDTEQQSAAQKPLPVGEAFSADVFLDAVQPNT